MMISLTLVIFGLAAGLVVGNPVILKGSSPSGQTLIAISSSNPNIEQHILRSNNGDSSSSSLQSYPSFKPEDIFQGAFAFGTPGESAGSARSFISTSPFNPFMFPLFHFPINLEGYGLSNNIGWNNILKGFENFHEPTFGSNGEVNSVTAVNDNGHVYGKINSVSFDNRGKGQ